jgi:phosphate/sulfate permease
MEILILILCLGVVLVFEFVNGMNDTANAIAPVIYSHSLEPRKSVLIAASLNFLGVMFGGIAVAMSILHLLPVDAIINAPTEVGVFLIIAILLSSIVWDLGAWWLALPVSSSHALIGSIIGVSIAFSMTTYGAEVIPNWHKAQEVIE